MSVWMSDFSEVAVGFLLSTAELGLTLAFGESIFGKMKGRR